MDNLFKIRTLTAAVNAIKAPSRRVYNRIFAPYENMQPSDRLAFDVISGSEKLLSNISIYAPATVDDKTSRKTITLTAPRIANKRFVATAELNAYRQFGGPGVQMMMDRIATEQKDMRGKHDRTLEFWAVNALKGVIYDSDLSTVLVDYNVDATHTPTLTGADLWTDAASDPIAKIRAWKKLIEDDSAAAIEAWVAFCGSGVMDALLGNTAVRELLKYDKGSQMAENGRIQRLAEVELDEYNGSYVDASETRQRYIGSDEFLLVGICDELAQVPYAPVVDDDAPGGVGNIGEGERGVMFFSKSWKEQDPSGRWIKCESRPLPVLKRPGAVVDATVI
ncbi:hypothetical protein DSCO28_07410 [Desulfosarcina ovata subsp. sediminis]|uniref:Minor capsid protein E n=1 Tax=Desulfosarcina ovata subsp. sediminis TaxID=885957 RepID=A0A5K7ZIZ7_9BACT|nr:major capsid protein [Desulfosarcina ovata]BBO80175.1 hypothetical protein DSCO28_07410 [Desulfosarcina ovata subsp. sediminis]